MSSTLTDVVSGVSTSVAVKPPVKCVAGEDVTLSGERTITDANNVEVELEADDRVLLPEQDDATENGIWIVKRTAWVRATDFDGARDVVKGTRIYTEDGNEVWFATSDGTPGEDAIEFEREIVRLEEKQFLCGEIDTELTVGIRKGFWIAPYDFTITGVFAALAGHGQDAGDEVTVDINKAGASILSTLITFDNGDRYSTNGVIDGGAVDVNEGQFVSADITQVGDGSAEGLIAGVKGHRRI